MSTPGSRDVKDEVYARCLAEKRRAARWGPGELKAMALDQIALSLVVSINVKAVDAGNSALRSYPWMSALKVLTGE